MNISDIDINFIEIFALSYTAASDIFEVDPVTASSKMKRKIRKWIDRIYVSDAKYPKKVMNYISKEVSDAKYIEFISECNNYIQLNGTHKKQLFDKFSTDLSKEVKDAIWELIANDTFCDSFRKVGADAEICIDNSSAYNRTLTLLNATDIPEGEFDCLSFENGSLIKQDDGYKLIGEAVNFEEDVSKPFAIRFSDAKANINIFKADEQSVMGTPWQNLQFIASEILSKYSLSEKYFNQKEKDLLPLIAEINKLSDFPYTPEGIETDGFAQLKTYILKFSFSELLQFIEKLEDNRLSRKKKITIIQKLISRLNTQKYEPLWREIYSAISDSQADYPSNASAFKNLELLQEARSKIQKFMLSQGYSGEYPNFVRKGNIKGIRLVDSYDMSYFIANEKNAVYHIHCTETFFDQSFSINFICGTELLREGEISGDIYSCMFSAKGRRLLHSFYFRNDFIDEGKIKDDALEKEVRIAVKIAELLKLTKEERKELFGLDSMSCLQLFLLVYNVMGILYSAFLILGLMLIGALVCLIVGQPEVIGSMLVDMPWWQLFLLAWILFGGAMSIITILAKRK